MQYCWWTKSCNTWDALGWLKPYNNGIDNQHSWWCRISSINRISQIKVGIFQRFRAHLNWTTTFGLARTTRYWKDRCLTKTWFSSIRKIGVWVPDWNTWMFWEVLLMEEILHQLIMAKIHYLHGFIYTSQVQDFWTINSSTSLITLPMRHPWDWYIYLHEWLIFMGHVYREIHPSQGCYGLLALKIVPQKPQTIRTWISMPNNCKCGCPRHFSASFQHEIHSMDLKVWESWIIGHGFFHVFFGWLSYISAPPWKSLHLQNRTQYNILKKQLKIPKIDEACWQEEMILNILNLKHDHHCLTFKPLVVFSFGWSFGECDRWPVTCCALRVLFWTLQWVRVLKIAIFEGFRIFWVNNFLRQSVSPNFSLPHFPETLQMYQALGMPPNTNICIYVYLEPVCPLFWPWTLQKKALSTQNKVHLGCRYIYIYIHIYIKHLYTSTFLLGCQLNPKGWWIDTR